jgi:hypothetical protein
MVAGGAHRVGVGGRRQFGGVRGCIGVGIGGYRGASGWESTHRGAARSVGFWGVGGRAGRHRHKRLR